MPLSCLLAAILVTPLLRPIPAAAADLKPATIQAWQDYVKDAETRARSHTLPGSRFLSVDASPAHISKLRRGEVLVLSSGSNAPVRVPDGLIHDWSGAIFLPGATLNDVFRVTRDYAQYSTFYHPHVVSARTLETGDRTDRFSLTIMNKSFFAKTALDSDYRATFVRLDDKRWYSVSETTRVQELTEFGESTQSMLPEGHGTGMIWRLFSIARYEERDGGVYIELEAIALSRDIPAGLHWLVEPIVKRVARSSLAVSLRQTAGAVQGVSSTATAGGVSKRSGSFTD